VLVRIVNMRGVNLNVFDFDYDLTWAALFMNADETIYGRFGGRDAHNADKYLSLAGLKYALRSALESHRRRADEKPPGPAQTRAAEEYAAARRLKANACIHCHQVYDFRHDEKKAAGTWRPADVWVYPQPENVGLSIDPEQGNRVLAVAADSAADRAGLHNGDVLQRVNGWPTASVADVQYALQLAPASGEIGLSWQRAGKEMTGKLALDQGWRQTDISWRASMWGLEPAPCVHGWDLTAQEKKTLGLSEKTLAFRQGKFVPAPSRTAGIREDDIILGIDNQMLEMTMLQFNAHVRLHYKTGDRITFQVLRAGKRLDVPMTLPARPF
jgi:hypothetical protein